MYVSTYVVCVNCSGCELHVCVRELHILVYVDCTFAHVCTWTAHELHILVYVNCTCLCTWTAYASVHELHMNCTWTAHACVRELHHVLVYMNCMIIHELHMNCTWTAHELHMNCTCLCTWTAPHACVHELHDYTWTAHVHVRLADSDW